MLEIMVFVVLPRRKLQEWAKVSFSICTENIFDSDEKIKYFDQFFF